MLSNDVINIGNGRTQKKEYRSIKEEGLRFVHLGAGAVKNEGPGQIY